MEANDPRGGAIFYHRGMIVRIYVNPHITMLHTEYRSFGSCGLREEDFFMYFPLYYRANTNLAIHMFQTSQNQLSKTRN